MKNKFWTFRNLTPTKGELLIYGPISEYSWWGDEVTPKQFADDLKALGDITELDVRINSGGGDVFAAQAIHSQLKAHKAIVNIYIDGLAASAASVIAMAGDTIYIPTNAMMMIHNPSTFAWGEADDLLKLVDVLEQVKKTIIAAYKAKTGRESEELSKLMDDETWMTGEEAVTQKFADVLLNTGDVQAALNGNMMVVNGQTFDLSKFKNRPKLMAPAASVPQSRPQAANNNTGGTTKMDLKELQEKHPELFNQAKNLGVEEERKRIKDIDDLAMPGYEDMVAKAKFETPKTAAELAMEIVKAEKQRGGEYLQNRQQDAQTSNANNVDGGAAPQKTEGDQKEISDMAQAAAAAAKQKKGVR